MLINVISTFSRQENYKLEKFILMLYITIDKNTLFYFIKLLDSCKEIIQRLRKCHLILNVNVLHF